MDDISADAIVVDPGCFNQDEEQVLSDFILSRGLKVNYLINTHCHLDHIFGCQFIKEKYDSMYLIPEGDLPLLKNAVMQAEMFGVEIKKPPQPDQFLSEKLRITLNESDIKFILTPGHTPGEYCLYLEKEKILISGDVLFKEGIGRTDLWGGDYDTLINSINKKLFTLPNDVLVYPGHGEETTIGYEKIYNPFCRK